MKRFVGLFALIGMGCLLALPASADTAVRVQLNTPGLQLATYGRDRYRSHRYDRRYRHRSFSNRRHYNSRYRSRGYRGGYNTYAGASCQRVSRRGYWHGRPALIGGRECIDRRGYAYIPSNSRYLIRYY